MIGSWNDESVLFALSPQSLINGSDTQNGVVPMYKPSVSYFAQLKNFAAGDGYVASLDAIRNLTGLGTDNIDFGNVTELDNASAVNFEFQVTFFSLSGGDGPFLLAKYEDAGTNFFIRQLNGQIVFNVGNGNWVGWNYATAGIAANTRVHLNFSFNGAVSNKVRLYVNGVDVGAPDTTTGTIPATLPDVGASLLAMGYDSYSTDGLLYWFCIYQRHMRDQVPRMRENVSSVRTLSAYISTGGGASVITMERSGLVDIEEVEVYQITNDGAPVYIETYTIPRARVGDLLVYSFSYLYTVSGNIGDTVVVRFVPTGTADGLDSFDWPEFTITAALLESITIDIQPQIPFVDGN